MKIPLTVEVELILDDDGELLLHSLSTGVFLSPWSMESLFDLAEAIRQRYEEKEISRA